MSILKFWGGGNESEEYCVSRVRVNEERSHGRNVIDKYMKGN